MADSITVRAGSEDLIDFTLRNDTDDDGIPDAPIDLTGMQSVTLKLRRADGLVVEFATTDPNPKLTITDAVAGELQLEPDEMTWANGDSWYAGYFLIIDGMGKDMPIAEDEEFSIIVRDAFVVIP